MSVILAMPPSLPCTKDGRWLNLTTMLPHQSAAVKRALGLEWMSDDPRYATAPMFPTPEDAAAYQDLYLGAWREKSLDEWLPILLADPDVPFEVAITSEEGLDHPQAIHNGQVVKVEDPVVGTIEEIGPLARFSATPSVIRASAPALDEHDALPPAPSATDTPVSGATLRHPLEMITIVEFGYFYAMPFGVAMVGSYGARVIKVEDLTGDPMRNSFPGLSEVAAAKTMEGKESIALDLRVPAGRKILDDLLARADVFVFGFRPSVAKRLALDYESVRRVNRRIVYMNAAGYGTSGPYSHRPIYASQASATAGGYGRQCGEKLRPELAAGRSLDELRSIAAELQPPVDGDSNAALGVATALSLAIYHQRRTGQGQLVETTMINSNAYTYADDYNRYEGKPPVALPDPGQYGLHALHRLYPASSGWVFASITTDAEWASLVATPGFETLADDERFATAASRRAHDAELVAALTAAFAERSAPDWESALTPLGLAVVEVYGGSMSDFTNTDAHLRALGLVGEVEHPIFGTILRHGVPVRFSDTPGRLAPGCVLSQHTDALLEELGYTTDEVEALKADGVVLRSPLSMLEGFPA
jgi:crotonobetainyl-CoA:carnitine CoA-transferase CaiB-like acyl-CoA transferase